MALLLEICLSDTKMYFRSGRNNPVVHFFFCKEKMYPKKQGRPCLDRLVLFLFLEDLVLLYTNHFLSGYIRIRPRYNGRSDQEEHHRVRTFREELVAMLRRTGVAFEERYLD